MRIGIISNSDIIIPLTYTLAVQKLQVYIFFATGGSLDSKSKLVDFSRQLNIPLSFEEEAGISLYTWVNREKFDAIFIMGYSSLIDIAQIDKTVKPTLFNIHFGPLPAYKGPSPVFWQLKHGVDKLGMAIHQLTEKFDKGPIVWRKEVPNHDFFCNEAASKYLSSMCAEGVLFILNLIAAKLPILSLTPLSMAIPSYHKRPEGKDVLIDWNKMSAREIRNLVRACNPWNRGAITLFRGQEVKLMDAQMLGPSSTKGKAGEIIDDNECLKIQTCDGNALAVSMLYYNDCYIPAYHGRFWGFAKGETVG
jgi:methionyl-tRNA formyltransferase